MATTAKERKALKKAGYEWNQYAQKWMSPEEFEKWLENQALEAKIYKIIYWSLAVISVVGFVVMFAVQLD